MLKSEPPYYRALQLSIAQAYADAVEIFLVTGEAAEVVQDGDGFTAASVEPGTSPTDVYLWVSDGWEEWVRSTKTVDYQRLGSERFRQKIVDELISTQATFELLKFFINRDDE